MFICWVGVRLSNRNLIRVVICTKLSSLSNMSTSLILPINILNVDAINKLELHEIGILG